MDKVIRDLMIRFKKKTDPVTTIADDGPPMWFILLICLIVSIGLTAMIYFVAISTAIQWQTTM